MVTGKTDVMFFDIEIHFQYIFDPIHLKNI